MPATAWCQGQREFREDSYLSPSPRRRGPEGGPRATWDRNGYQSIQVNVDGQGQNITGDAANEPTLAIDPLDPNRIVIGWRQFDNVASNFRQAGWAYSHDGGQTWNFPGVLEEGVFRSDPVLDVDAGGTFYYQSLKPVGNVYTCYVFKSADGGISWLPPTAAYGGDKNWMVIDRTTGIGRGNVYEIWQRYNNCCDDRTFTRSTDGGATFINPIHIPSNPTFGTLAVGPDGEVYAAGMQAINFQDFTRFVVAKSINARDPAATPVFATVAVNLGGAMSGWTGPNPDGLLGQAWIQVDHSNGPTRSNVYLLCSVDPPGPDPLDVMFSRSTDGGATWSPPVRINDDLPGSNAYQWFGTLSVAPDGRIDVAWNDTRNDPLGARSEVYYARSVDGGLTWSVNIPVTPSFDHSLGYPNQRKLGDYYHMISDDAGASLAYAATFNGEQDVYFLRIPLIPADFDRDLDVDLDDFAAFEACFSGPTVADSGDCAKADFDLDNDVDMNDFGVFQRCYSGAGRPADPGCAGRS